jgi:hypothetical protein
LQECSTIFQLFAPFNTTRPQRAQTPAPRLSAATQQGETQRQIVTVAARRRSVAATHVQPPPPPPPPHLKPALWRFHALRPFTILPTTFYIVCLFIPCCSSQFLLKKWTSCAMSCSTPPRQPSMALPALLKMQTPKRARLPVTPSLLYSICCLSALHSPCISLAPCSA